MSQEAFTEQQIHYLEGFAAGAGLSDKLKSGATFGGTLGLSSGQAAGAANAAAGPEAIHYRAQDQQVAAGKKLCAEESAKRKRFPLDQWDDIRNHSRESKFPKGTDVLAFKYHGLFYVAPAQNAYMARLRFAGGVLPTFQFRRVADVAEAFGGGYADVTTRANLQVREIQADDAENVLQRLHEAGVIIRGSGADNIRNITGGPTAGIDPQELIDTRPLSTDLHHYILNHREMYGLPRKFNIAFDGGGRISSVEDSNDIGFTAARVSAGRVDADGKPIEPGVYFRMALGGITGHKDFARDEGVLIAAEDCVAVSAAVVRVFIEHGDRTNRQKARLKYLLDQWGHEKFLAETEKALGRPLRRLALDQCEPRLPIDKLGHIGFHTQRQPGLSYVGVLLPVGRMTVAQMRGLADIADRHGSGTIRLTVWQNLLISDVPNESKAVVQQAIEALGLSCEATHIDAGLIACTGAAGCKFALAHTKQSALQLSAILGKRVLLDTPINIHFTGCPNSCAQHYMGDIGLLGTKVEVADDMVEGYHIYVGGGYGADQSVGREVYRSVVAPDVPMVVEKMLRAYQALRSNAQESFNQFVRRHETAELVRLFAENTAIEVAADPGKIRESVLHSGEAL